jgi:4-alpha-glucanotransferase
MTHRTAHTPLQQRQAGILLHPTSLPGPWHCGDLGSEAWHFVDFLAAAGQHVWQILPLGPTHDDMSPYQSLSAHAGNPQLISIEALQAQGWLDGGVIPDPRPEAKAPLIARAWHGFNARADDGARAELQQFIDASHWLEDYALFRIIKQVEQGRGWNEWPAPLRDREPAALARLRESHADELAAIRFEQFIFEQQWQALKRHANGKGITIFGDMPIFVAHDSADVWAQRQCFDLDESGRPTVVAGVPPDYFSATGQRWGNPHYDWEWMEADGFSWWRQRLEGQLRLFDLVRIDHFRGFEAYWEVPVHEETAINGRWVKAPGDALFATLLELFDPLPVVAEDLGTITPEVTELRTKYALPGMRILHFAFDGSPDNPYLPHNHDVNSVVYTGTHDNDTTLGWYDSLPESVCQNMNEYLGQPGEAMPWPLIRAAYASVARLAIVPLQDVLELGAEHRMNTPGTVVGNWQWRFRWEQVTPDRAPRLLRLTELYRRR